MADESESKDNNKRYVQISKPEQSCGHDHSDDKDHCYFKGRPMSHELFSHLPFSVLSVTAGLIFAGLICFMVPDALVEKAGAVIHAHDHGSHDDHDCEDHESHEGMITVTMKDMIMNHTRGMITATTKDMIAKNMHLMTVIVQTILLWVSCFCFTYFIQLIFYSQP